MGRHSMADGAETARLPQPDRTGEPIKLLYLTESMEVAGAEQVILALVRRLDRRRFLPIVGCLADEGPLAPEIRALGVRVVAFGKRPGFHPEIVVQMARFLRTEGIAILHTHVWPADVWGRLAARLAATPIVLTTAHNIATWKTPAQLMVDRVLLGLSARLVCVSGAVAAFYRDRAGLDEAKLVQIYNGIDASRFTNVGSRAESRRTFGVTEDQVVLTVVGRLIEQKGHRYFLEALDAVRNRHPQVVAWLVGDGPNRQALERLAAALGLGPPVLRFLGERKDVPALLEATDILVHPTHVLEAHSVALLEAMAAGKPIVATCVGGNPETIIDGKSGLLVPPGSATALVQAITYLLALPDQSARLATAARHRAITVFPVERMTAAYAALYDQLLAGA